MRVIDVFIFYNELDLLEYRLEVLSPHVDKFVIIEGDLTHTGKEKPLYFLENQERFKPYLDKIVYHVAKIPCTDQDCVNMKLSPIPPQTTPSFIRERAQRIAAADALKSLDLSDDDLIHFSDADEIPNMSVVLNAYRANKNVVLSLQQDLYIQCIHLLASTGWRGPFACSFQVFKQYKTDEARLHRFTKHRVVVVSNAGWHLSYFGAAKMMKQKLSNFSHQEQAVQKYNREEYLEDCVAQHRMWSEQSPASVMSNEQLLEYTNAPPLLDKYLTKFSYCASVSNST